MEESQMMETNVNPQVSPQATETAVEAATVAIAESVAATETAQEAQAIAEQAAMEAQQAVEKTEKLTSWNEYALRDVKEILMMQHQKMETLAGILKETQIAQAAINQELKDTLELLQSALGDVDEQVRKMVLATAALVKLASVKA